MISSRFYFSSLKKSSRVLLLTVLSLFAVVVVNNNNGSQYTPLFVPDIYDFSDVVRANIEKLKNSNFSKDSSKLLPFIRMKSHYRIAPDYNISACIVEKAMCTVIQGLFCYLYDSKGFVENNRTVTTDPWPTRFCLRRNEPLSSQQRHKALPQRHENIFVVRDPIERFLSGFTDKCIHENSTCYGCKGDIFCAVEKLREDLYKTAKKHPDYKKPRKTHVRMRYETQHLAPSTWYCDLWNEPANYLFLKYGEDSISREIMLENLMFVLKSHKVEKEKLEYIKKSLTERTHHATKHSSNRRELSKALRKSKRHMKILMEIYYYDYVVFGLTPPKI